MDFDPLRRRDLHERFLAVRARERARYAEHVKFVKRLVLPPVDRDEEWIRKLRRRLESQP